MLAGLGGLFAGTEPIIAHNIVPVLASLAEIEALGDGTHTATLPASSISIPACRGSDFDPRELAILAAGHARLAGIPICATSCRTWFRRSSADDPLNAMQRQRFPRPGANCRRHRAAWPIRPASFSAPASAPTSHGRGRALRHQPTPAANPMRPVVPLTAACWPCAISPAGDDGRRQRHLDGPRPEPHATVGARLCRWLAPPHSNRGGRTLTAPRPAGRPCLHGPDNVRRDRHPRSPGSGWNCSDRHRPMMPHARPARTATRC